jgi:uncharacterized protein (TIGR02186 family)
VGAVQILIFVLVLFIGFPLAHATERELAVATSIEQVDVDIRYRGEEIQLFGEVQPRADVLIQVITPLETVKVHKKGRVLGFLWMDVKQAEISNVPGAYQEISSTTLDRLSPKIQESTQIDGNYRFVREMAQVNPADEDAQFLVDGYIKAKEKQKLYGHHEKAVGIIKGRLFRAEFQLPSRAPIGEYRLEIYTIKGDQLVGHGTATLRVEQIGMQQWITQMAKEHGGLYGLIAVAIALVAGFGVGLIFKGRYQ